MARHGIDVSQLSDAISAELKDYNADITDGVKKASKKAARNLVKKTKAHRFKKGTGKLTKGMTTRTLEETDTRLIMQWYVKGKHASLAHLLEDGHAKRNGGRVQGQNYLKNALPEINDMLESDVEGVIKNGH